MSCILTSPQPNHGVSSGNVTESEESSLLWILESLYKFELFYESFHPFISFALCLLGIFANIIHICVLTRQRMRRSSVHVTLIFVGIADIGTMASYLIYIIRFEFFMDSNGYSYAWAEFLRLHAATSVALHGVSLYLVVFMAFIRLMALRIGHFKWMMPKFASAICILIFCIVFIICIPTLLAHQIYENESSDNSANDVIESISQTLLKKSLKKLDDYDQLNVKTNEIVLLPNEFLWEWHQTILAQKKSNQKYYKVGFSTRFLDQNCALLKFNYWLTGILLKSVPCLLLLCFTFALLRRLRANERKRHQLLSKNPQSKYYDNINSSRSLSLTIQNNGLEQHDHYQKSAHQNSQKRQQQEQQQEQQSQHQCHYPSQVVPTKIENNVINETVEASYLDQQDLENHFQPSMINNKVDDYNNEFEISIKNKLLNHSNLSENITKLTNRHVKKPAKKNEDKRCFPIHYSRILFPGKIISKLRNSGNVRYSKAADRTSYILLLMLTIFLLTELPQGIFAMLSAIFAYQFHGYVYMSIADVLDLLSLINCHVAFVVYMFTSSTYRQTLALMFSSLFNSNFKLTKTCAQHHSTLKQGIYQPNK